MWRRAAGLLKRRRLFCPKLNLQILEKVPAPLWKQRWWKLPSLVGDEETKDHTSAGADDHRGKDAALLCSDLSLPLAVGFVISAYALLS